MTPIKIYSSNEDIPNEALKEAYSQTRNPGYYNRDGSQPQTMSPDDVIINGTAAASQEFLTNPETQRVWQQRQAQQYSVPQGEGKPAFFEVATPQQTYWEDPQRVVRYYNFMRAAPPDTQLPEWIDPNQITAAYKYLKFRNGNVPWTQWKALPNDDPGTSFLQQLKTPPPAVLTFPGEDQYKETALTQANESRQDPFGDWNNLKPWQQFALGAFSPQPGLLNRPEWTRLTASLGQGALAGLGGAAAGAALGSVVPGLGTVAGAAAGFLLTAGATGYQSYTGQEIPVIGQVLGLMNLPAQWLEQGVGLGEQVQVQGLEEVLANLPAAWQAGQMAYETSNANLLNLIAQAAGDQPAAPGEAWQIQRGVAEPVKIEGPTGAPALVAMRERITAGEDPTMLYIEAIDRYGFSGTFDDFIAQTVLDPLQLAPFLEGRAGQGIAKLAGNERLAAAFKMNTGSPAIDLLPFGVKEIAKAVTGLPESKGLFASLETYKNMVRSGYQSTTPAASLTSWEKRAGRLNAEGQFKELQPASGQTGVKGWIEYLGSLTPEAKAEAFTAILRDNMAALTNLVRDDPEAVVKIWKQAAGADPVAAGQVGEAILNSPETATVAVALRQIVKAGLLDELLAEWKSADGHTDAKGVYHPGKRDLLKKFSQALNETPDQILKAYDESPEILARRISDASGTTTTAKNLDAVLGVFTGDDAIPHSPEQFLSKLTITAFDKMGDWTVQHFGIKEDPAIIRFNKMLKTAQSLLLLNFNPAYAWNNEITNVATRAAVGVFGYMTPRQIESFLSRFEITPETLNTSGLPGYDEATPSSISSKIQAAKETSGALAQAQRVVSALSDKLGAFSKLSANFERLESQQSMVIGMTQFMREAWREGKGFRKMSPDLEATLDRTAPGMKQAIYAAVRSGMNMREIAAALFGETIQPQVSAIIDEVAAQHFPGHPELGTQLFDATGLRAQLEKDLLGATTPGEVDAAFKRAENALQSHMLILKKQAIVHRAEEAANLTKAERIPAVLSMYADMQARNGELWLTNRREWDDLYARKNDLTPEQWNQEVETLFSKQRQDWQNFYDFETQTTAGIIKALGIEGTNGDYAKALLERQQNWKTYHKESDKLRREYFSNRKRKAKETREEWQARTNKEWNILQDKMDDLYLKHSDAERAIQKRMDSFFARDYQKLTDWDPARVAEWRGKLADMRYEQVQAQQAQRKLTRNMLPDERDAAYAEFNPTYNRMIADQKELEIRGAYELAEAAKQAKASEGEAAAQRVEAAVPPERPAAPAQPTESDINAQLASAERQPRVSAKVLTILADALKAGVVDKNGKVIQPYVLNIINKRQPEGQKFKTLEDADPIKAAAALEDHKNKYAHRKAQEAARLQLNAQDIIKLADKQAREAAITAAGMMTRRAVRDQLARVFGASDVEIEAAMTIMDLHAERVMGKGEANIEAWYATHVADIVKGEDEFGQEGLTQGYNNLYQQVTADRYTGSQMIERAKQMLTPVQNLENSGWLTPDGQLLSFDDRHNTHQNIATQISGETTDPYTFGKRTGMVRIEANPDSLHVELFGRPTPEQVHTIAEQAKRRDFTFVDVSKATRVTGDFFARNEGDRLRAYLSEAHEAGSIHQGPKGSVQFLDDGRAVIRALEAPDISTIVHEVGHIFRRDLSDADMEVIAHWGGLQDAAEFRELQRQVQAGELTQGQVNYNRYVAAEEQFARGWERYLAEGDAPTPELRGLFARFTDWMLKIYQNLRRAITGQSGTEHEIRNWGLQQEFTIGNKTVDIHATIDGVNIRDIFDRLLVEKPDRYTPEPEPVKPPPTIPPQQTAFMTAPLKELPAPVLDAVKQLAAKLAGELQTSTNVIAADGTTHWEGPYWYGQIIRDIKDSNQLDPKAKNTELSAAKKTYLGKLNSISRGREQVSNTTSKVRGLLLEALLGESKDLPTDVSAAVLWYMGEKDNLFATFAANFDDATPEWLAKEFGDEGSQAMDEYLLWADEHAGETIPEPMQPAGPTRTERWETVRAEQEATTQQFEAGQPVEIDRITGLELTPAPEMDEPAAVRQARESILSGLSKAEADYAAELIDYRIFDGGNDLPTSTLPIAQENRVKALVDQHAQALDDYRRSMTEPQPVSETKPGKGLQVLRVHKMKHGEYIISAAVYKDGQPVALLPGNGEAVTQFETDNGSARLLGLDPEDPQQWVIERNGETSTVDPEKPAIQAGLFTAEDMPLFSGTPMRAQTETFAPQETGQQDSLFNRADYLPTIGAKKAEGEAAGPLFERPQEAPAPETKPNQAEVGDIVTITLHNGRVARVRVTSISETASIDFPRLPIGEVIENVKTKGARGKALEVGEKIKLIPSIITDIERPNHPAPQWKYEDYSQWSRQLARDYTRAEIKKQLGKVQAEQPNAARSHLRAVEKTGSMQGNSQHRAQAGNVVRGLYERRMALENALELYEFYPEKTKEGLKTNQLYQGGPDSYADTRPIGNVPLGGAPVMEPTADAVSEITSEQLNPMLRSLRERYKQQLGARKLRMGDLDPATRSKVEAWTKQVEGDLGSTKLAAIRYGEQMRDSALLNYNRKYGADTIANLVFPYQFWYTRSMVNWAKRMVDRPAWFATYARMQQKKEEMANSMPTRLKGQMRLPAPWMPEWAGGGFWFDPLSKVLPFDSFGQPLEQFNADRNQVNKRAQTLLQAQMKNGEISRGEYDEAISGKSSAVWKRAETQASMELDKSTNPVSMVGMMMSPALWWTGAMNIANGTPENISPLPITRTGQSIRYATQGTALEQIGKLLGGAMAAPEEWARKKAGLNEFGAWGDYLIDRELANMAADGTTGAEQARIAMIERTGPLFEEARSRVMYQQMLKTPGATSLQQAAQGNVAGIVESLPTLFFGGSLFPEGELKLRGLQDDYSKAWTDHKAGNKNAINDFLAKNPEYEARLALYDQPDERLKQFLISTIWDRYTSLEKPNQRKAQAALGQDFTDHFLNKETRSYDTLTPLQLATWATILGGNAPKTTETLPGIEQGQLKGAPDYWTPEESKAISAYQEERGKKFPNYYAIQSGYYALPEKSQARKNYLKDWPELKAYWDWKDQQKKLHPELAGYFEESAASAAGAQPAIQISEKELGQVNAALMRQLLGYKLAGQQLSTGASAELNRIMKLSGRSMPAQEYADQILLAMYGGQ